MPHLLQQIDAKSPAHAVDLHRVREVGPARLLENLAVPLVHHRHQQPLHFLVVDRAAIERAQAAFDAHVGRAVGLQVQVAPLQLHQRGEQLVDFQFLSCAFSVSTIFESVVVAMPVSVPRSYDIASGAFHGSRIAVVAELQDASRTGMPRSRMTRLVSLDRVLAKMKNAGSQRRVGLALENRVGQMLGLARSSAGHDRNSHRLADRAGNLQIVAVFRAVGIHAGQHDFAGAQTLHLAGPGHGLEPGSLPPAMNMHLPEFAPVLLHPLGVDIDDDALAAEAVGRLADKLGILGGRRIDRNLVAAGQQQISDIVERANSAPHAQGHKDHFGRPPDYVQHDVAAFVAGRNIQEHQLIGPFRFIARRHGHRIAGVAQVDKVGPFHHSSPIDVEARNHALGKHGKTASWRGL